NCQKACKKCDEGRPCTRCVKYGLTDTCVDSTRKVRKKGIKRGPYKRRPPPSQLGSASVSVSTSPTMRNAVITAPGPGSAPMGHHLPTTLDFAYDNGSSSASNSNGYSFHPQRIESSYQPTYAPSYPPPSMYTSSYGMSSHNSNS
ncbi:hypothetical protein BGZ94_006307, partial [Podila epigama]